MSTLSVIGEYAHDDVDHAKEAEREVEDIGREVDKSFRRDPGADVSAREVERAGELASGAKLFAQDANVKAEKANRIANGIVSFKPNPPIDGLLHSVQFVVTYGGSLSPVWTLLLWKGPGTLPAFQRLASGPTASTSRSARRRSSPA